MTQRLFCDVCGREIKGEYTHFSSTRGLALDACHDQRDEVTCAKAVLNAILDVKQRREGR